MQWLPIWEKDSCIFWSQSQEKTEKCQGKIYADWAVDFLWGTGTPHDGTTEHLVLWASSWEKGAAISNLEEAVVCLEG